MRVFYGTAVAALVGLAAAGTLLVFGADDTAGNEAAGVEGARPPVGLPALAAKRTGTRAGDPTMARGEAPCPKPREAAWEKAIAAWKAEKVSEPADNSYCDVCHVNYQQEKLAKTHKKAGVGCETCHGISDKHSEDEDNMIPPDIMYLQPRIMAFCMGCHEKAKIAKDDNHEDIFSKDADPEDTCTDCHGEKHHLEVRTRKWNKETGKLIWSDGVRMMQKMPSAGQ